MAFIFRITFTFDEPKQGWSESWYQSRATNDPLAALDDAELVVQKRSLLLGSGAFLTHSRASCVLDTTGPTKLTRIAQGREQNGTSGSNAQLLPPSQSLLVRCIPADRTKRKDVYLGGLPKNIAGTLKQFDPPAGFLDAFRIWANAIRAKEYGWLHQNILNDVNVIGWTFDVDTGRTTYHLDGPITFDPKSKIARVTVSIPGGHESLEGVQIVQPVPNAPNDAITARPRPTHAYDGRIGRMKSYSYTFVALTTGQTQADSSRIDPQKLVKRSRGRPLYAERGRAPVRVLF